jgi:YD repeat-containing protein
MARESGYAKSPRGFSPFKAYQEGAAPVTLAKLATEMGLPSNQVDDLLNAAGMSLGLGDLNGDGLTDGIAGHVVLRRRPTVTLLPKQSVSTALAGGISQVIETRFAYNAFGQLVYAIDPERNRTEYSYFPENNPDGGTTPNPAPLTTAGAAFSTATGGYIKQALSDSRVMGNDAAQVA